MFELGYVETEGDRQGGQWTIVDSDYRNPNSLRRNNKVKTAERHLFEAKQVRPQILPKYRFCVVPRAARSAKEEIATRNYRLCQLFPNWEPDSTFNGIVRCPIDWGATTHIRELLRINEDGRIQTIPEAIDFYTEVLAKKMSRKNRRLVESNLKALREISDSEPIAYGIYDPEVPGQLNEVVPVPLAAVRMNEEKDGKQEARFYVIGFPDEMLFACMGGAGANFWEEGDEEEEEEEAEEVREDEGPQGDGGNEGDGENAQEEEEIEME